MDYKQLSASLTRYRGNWETLWQEVAERCLTDQADFNTTQSPGKQRSDKVFDPTTAIAIDRSASAIVGLITPKSELWHTLSTDDPELNKSQDVKRYFDEVQRILFANRYAAYSGFSTTNWQCIRSLMGFGTGIMTVNEAPNGRGIIYQPLFLGDVYFGVDNHGRIDTVMREFEFNRSQCIQQWGEDKLPKKILADKGDTRFKFCHIAHPNEAYVEGSVNKNERQFTYVYLFKEEMENVIEDGGYYSFPYAICREVTSPNEIYGRSPAMKILPEIKGLNQMRKNVITASHLTVAPPMLASHNAQGVGTLGAGPMAINFKPSGITYGGVNAQGQQMIQPMNIGARPDFGQQAIEDSRQIVNDSFYLTLFQILVETKTMTATEVLARTQEKGILLAPTADRLESEYLGPMIDRELDILSRQGLLPELPSELIEAGGEYTIRYESPITRAQRASQSLGIQETFNMAITAAGIDQSVMDLVDFDEMIRKTADNNGTPATAIRSEQEVEELRQQRAQAQQQQQMLEQAPALAGAVKDIATAENMGM